MKDLNNKKIFLTGTIIVILIGIILPTIKILAADGDYTFLAPLPTLPNALSSKNILGEYLPAVFKLAVGLAAVFAVLMLVVGGFQYISTDAIQGKTEGRERVKNAVIGLVFVIGAWLILNTINPNLLNFDLNIEPVTTASPAGETPGGGRVATGADLLTGESLLADSRVRENLGTIGINNPPCTPQRTSSCTNLNGLPMTMVENLRTLQINCGGSGSLCPVMITGGTETSLHSTGTRHGPGNSVVDLAPSSRLNTYLGYPNPTNGQTATKDGLNFKYETAGGYSTGNHWHVYK